MSLNVFAKYITVVISLFSGMASYAGVSPLRAPEKDYRTYLHALKARELSARPFPEQSIVEWESLDKLQEFFEETRDERFLKDDKEFSRRITWLFPDNGCFARAALVIHKAEELGVPVPNRVFIYGNLKVRTPNAPDQFVTWWYHTAPIVRIRKDLYVLDASLNPYRPLLLKEWVDLQLPSDAAREIKLCHPHSYDAESSCSKPYHSPLEQALSDIEFFLRAEWKRQVLLQRDPIEVLGENPPWKVAP